MNEVQIFLIYAWICVILAVVSFFSKDKLSNIAFTILVFIFPLFLLIILLLIKRELDEYQNNKLK